MRRLPTILFCLAAAFWAGASMSEPPKSAPPAQIAGVASVIDGDTIEIHGQRIRLSGFDTPERGRKCSKVNVYQKAALYLSDVIGTQTVTCDVTGTNGDRLVATCQVDGADLGELMVTSGWGRDWPKYSQRKYAGAEASARDAARGLWGLDCPATLWGTRNYD